MNNIWNNVYSNDSSFFGDEPSKFALIHFLICVSNSYLIVVIENKVYLNTDKNGPVGRSNISVTKLNFNLRRFITIFYFKRFDIKLRIKIRYIYV